MLLFSFDAETDGLYGEAFAIGAVVVEESGRVTASFGGKCVAPGVASVWVRENCLPHLDRLPDYDSREALREAFWAFYLQYRSIAVPVADVPYPVEAQLLRACVQHDPEERTWLAPFPLIDVASAFFAKGLDPHTDRMAFSGFAGRPHDPVCDATASALCLLRLLR